MFQAIIPNHSRFYRWIPALLLITWWTAACNFPLTLFSNPAEGEKDENHSLPLVPVVSQKCPKDGKGGGADYYLCVNYSWQSNAPGASTSIQLDPKSQNVVRFTLQKKGSGSAAKEDPVLNEDFHYVLTGSMGVCTVTGRSTVRLSIVTGTCTDTAQGGVLALTLKEIWKDGEVTTACPGLSPQVEKKLMQPSTQASGVEYLKTFSLRSGGDTIFGDKEEGLSVYHQSWTAVAMADLSLNLWLCHV
jgi:hypothetical protein